MKLVMLIFVWFLLIPAANSEQILVNKPQSANDKRYDYPHTLLQMILKQTEKDYEHSEVAHSAAVMSRDRMLLSLVNGDLLHVVAEAPKKEWLEKLLVVRIPIRKGIQGYRLFFVNKDDLDGLARVSSLQELMKYPTGSGVGWSTAKIMSDAGFEVVTGNNYDGLFDMLEKRRFLTLGRGVNEIRSEYAIQKQLHPNLAIEPTLALHIPLPTYFFVSPKKPLLAQRIEEGLWKLIEAGEFEEYFLSYHRDMIEETRLKERKVFPIPNPNLSDLDPVKDKRLWYSF